MVEGKDVSPVHARIVLEDGHFYLEDAGSSFGTFVGLPKKKYFEVCDTGAPLTLTLALAPNQPPPAQ